MKLSLQLVFLVLFATGSSAFAGENQNNWQHLFPNVPSISLAEIENSLDKIVLVDVRAKFHFDQKHKEGAKHMSFSSRMFMLDMENLIEENKGKTIVVYCDTDNCIKSYRAVEKCQNAKLENVVLFDLNTDMAITNQDKIYTQL
ncbi:MAG: rhodanese-like domain-containing protein [Gammaproteobacteria bacterium]|nr:rhodanese-like domain-containing protein [Gammaproteobacteria bacterium]